MPSEPRYSAAGVPLRDDADRRDVIGGEHVVEHRQHARAPDVVDLGPRRRHVVEERWAPYEGAGRVPRECDARGAAQGPPPRRALPHRGETRAVKRRRHRLAYDSVDLRAVGPDVVQVYRPAFAVLAERFCGQVDEHAARQRIGHHERRRGEEAGPHGRVNAALEIAIAREDGYGGGALRLDRLGHRGRQGTGVAHAGHAAEARRLEAEGVERALQAAPREIVGDDARAGRERRLHPRARLQPARNRVPREQARADHHRRVRGVGAARDRGDHHVAVLERRGRGTLFRLLEAARKSRNAAGAAASGTRSCGRLGPATLGSTAERSTSITAVNSGGGVSASRHKSLRLAVGLDQGDLCFVAPGQSQVAQRLGVHREEAHGGAVLRAHVGYGGAVGHRERRHAGPEVLDELVHHLVTPQRLRDGQDDIRGGDAGPRAAGEPAPDDLRHQHRDRFAQRAGAALEAADAPAEDAEAVDHGGVAVHAEDRVRVGARPRAARVARPHHPREVLEIDLVTDAVARRHDAQVVEGLCAPAQERVALRVALELQRLVAGRRIRRGVGVDHHRVVDDEVDGHRRVEPPRIAAEPDHRVAHRRQVAEQGHARGVGHQHAREAEGDLAFGAAAGAAIPPPRRCRRRRSGPRHAAEARFRARP